MSDAAPYDRLGIVGGGAWGTALAAAARRAGRPVTLWAREAEVCESLRLYDENRLFLPGLPLPSGIEATQNLADLADCPALLLVTPAQYTRAVAGELAEHIGPDVPVTICAKGIEVGSRRLLSEVVGDALPGRPQAVLSGPTFAAETARGLPTAVTVASRDAALAERLAATLQGPNFRPYLGSDPTGALVGGAVKNVIAIAAGIVLGRQLGENARAGIITRGLAEIQRLADALGAQRDTIMGLSGLGDIVLTCGSVQSRNMSLGKAVGEGRRAADVLAERRSVAEGVYTAEAIHRLAGERGVDMPIARAVHEILSEDAPVEATMEALFNRPLRSET